jgi:hypothetical protein
MASLCAPIPILAVHDCTQFDCGAPNLNDWLKSRALKNESRFSRTFVVCDENRVAAFYCLSAGSIDRASTPSKVRRNAPDSIPIAILGRLAVCRTYAGNGLGGDILSDALKRVAYVSKTIGIGAILIQARDEHAKRFYLSCAEFLEFPDDSRTLFLPIETIVAAFGLEK